jgi:hypothetical protein
MVMVVPTCHRIFFPRLNLQSTSNKFDFYLLKCIAHMHKTMLMLPSAFSSRIIKVVRKSTE